MARQIWRGNIWDSRRSIQKWRLGGGACHKNNKLYLHIIELTLDANVRDSEIVGGKTGAHVS